MRKVRPGTMILSEPPSASIFWMPLSSMVRACTGEVWVRSTIGVPSGRDGR